MRSHDASSILGLVCSRRCTSAGQQAIASLYDAGRRRYRVKNSTASAQQRRRRGRGADPIGPRPCPRPRSRRDPILFREAAERQVYVPLRKYPSHFSRARGHGGPPWAFCSPFRSCLHPEHPRAASSARPLFYLQVDVWDTKYAVESVYCLSYMCPAGSWLPNMCIAAAWLLLRGPRPLARVSDCLSAPRIRGLRALDNPARSIP